jgi:hypothetical protein
MSDYKIKKYSYEQAKKLGVDIKPSSNKKKKIDVFKEGNKIASIGANGYKDFGMYLEENGKAYANKRRTLYKNRHEKDRKIKNSNGWFASNILW